VRTSTGQRSFAFHGPSVWNSLPRDSSLSLKAFKGRLKTHFTSVVDNNEHHPVLLGRFVIVAPSRRRVQTYLLRAIDGGTHWPLSWEAWCRPSRRSSSNSACVQSSLQCHRWTVEILITMYQHQYVFTSLTYIRTKDLFYISSDFIVFQTLICVYAYVTVRSTVPFPYNIQNNDIAVPKAIRFIFIKNSTWSYSRTIKKRSNVGTRERSWGRNAHLLTEEAEFPWPKVFSHPRFPRLTVQAKATKFTMINERAQWKNILGRPQPPPPPKGAWPNIQIFAISHFYTKTVEPRGFKFGRIIS